MGEDDVAGRRVDGVRPMLDRKPAAGESLPVVLARVASAWCSGVAGRSLCVAFAARGRRGEDLTGRTAIVVDDGVATGATARAACSVARDRGAMWVVLAVPVAPPDATVPEADELVCVETPSPFLAVGNHYRSFPQTEDHEVTELLDAAARGTRPPEP